MYNFVCLLYNSVQFHNECRMSKRQKAFSKLIYQPPQKANCLLDYIHLNENRQFSQRKLLAKQSFAVEILEFRLSIIVIKRRAEITKMLGEVISSREPPNPQADHRGR